MKHSPLLLFLFLIGCPPGLHNDDDDVTGDDDDATSDDDDATGDDDDATADDDDVTGDDDDVTADDDDTVDPPLLPFGASCSNDQECLSRVCWDWADYDPWCGGTICSDVCQTDSSCQDAALSAGAPDPLGARCGTDGLCDLVSTGLGAFWCADGEEDP